MTLLAEIADFIMGARIYAITASASLEASPSDRERAAEEITERVHEARRILRLCDPDDAGERLFAALLAELATAWVIALQLLNVS